jgi:hypothetical protein
MSNVVQQAMAKANVAAKYDPNDPLTPIYANLVATYANKTVFANQPIRDAATAIESCLRARKVTYWKNTPGDCGTSTKISASAIQTGSKIGLASAGTLTSLASAGIFGGAAGASGVAAEVSSVAVSGAFAAATAGIGLALVPIIAIINHHKAAVAKEQGNLCEAVGFFNSGIDAVAQANVDWKTKKDYFNTITTQALSAVQTVAKGSKDSSQCNAGCMIGECMLALRDLYIMIYAQPPSAQPDIIGVPMNANGSGPTAVNSQNGAVVADLGKSALVAGGGAYIAHLVGAF